MFKSDANKISFVHYRSFDDKVSKLLSPLFQTPLTLGLRVEHFSFSFQGPTEQRQGDKYFFAARLVRGGSCVGGML